MYRIFNKSKKFLIKFLYIKYNRYYISQGRKIWYSNRLLTIRLFNKFYIHKEF